jgi:hypothetical protein
MDVVQTIVSTPSLAPSFVCAVVREPGGASSPVQDYNRDYEYYHSIIAYRTVKEC